MSPEKRDTAYIGLGSNLNDPVRQLCRAVSALQTLPESQLIQCSSLYASAPIGNTDQPDFINAVCELETGLPPERLMQVLLDIEAGQGRDRSDGKMGGPRTLDLDLLVYGQIQQTTARVVLPHPRLHQRAFVLYPLSEIASQLIIPGWGSVTDLLENCKGQQIERLPERWLEYEQA
jgi:2-amino-4-hydroxy-6-hydroxymethyldihydropteridine diphosphokinase